MKPATSSKRNASLARTASGPATFRKSISQAWKALMARLFVSYRPDRYYMRGPGPKWREGHGRSWDDLH